MQHLNRKLFLTVLYLTAISTIFSQTFTVSVATNSVQKTCFPSAQAVNYTITITPPAGYVYGTDYVITELSSTIELRSPSNTVLVSQQPITNGTNIITGSFANLNLSPESYSIKAVIAINNMRDHISVLPSNQSFFMMGYGASWEYLLDMSATPTMSSLKKTTTTSGVSYARGLSFNQIKESENGFIDLSATYGLPVSAGGEVYLVIGNSTPMTTDPTLEPMYLLFKKVNLTTGNIIVKANGTSTTLAGVNHTARITLKRINGVIQFYNSSTNTVISNSPSISYTGKLNVSVFTNMLNAAVSNVVCSHTCYSNKEMFIALKRELSGDNYKISGKLCFVFDEEYQNVSGTVVKYKIFDLDRKVKQSSSVISGSTVVPATRIYGDNRIQMDISSLTINSTYILEVTNEKNEVFYLRFTKKI